MNTVKEIQNYIGLVNIPKDICEKYCMYVNEAFEIYNCYTPLEAIAFSFEYGRAKGYQAAIDQQSQC